VASVCLQRNCGRRGCCGMEYEQLEFLSASFELTFSEKAVHWVSRRKPRDQRFQKSIVYKKRDMLMSVDFVELTLDSTDCFVAMRYESLGHLGALAYRLSPPGLIHIPKEVQVGWERRRFTILGLISTTWLVDCGYSQDSTCRVQYGNLIIFNQIRKTLSTTTGGGGASSKRAIRA
jgi:hypothetical protein